jgi:hypothetical protein
MGLVSFSKISFISYVPSAFFAMREPFIQGFKRM